MIFHAKMPEKGRNNVFRDNVPSNNERLMCLDGEFLRGCNNCVFSLCQQTGKSTLYVFSV